ncbi:MAG: DNA mismatch repair protein MutS, partial [Candidatus Electryoneaceae bacterium]|nr:DNA mismatch repair protein MutS [Candidatus Electryoneaceae bacterium]
MKRSKPSRTPMLEQFMTIKQKHPDSVLFYRMGDFYEMFYDDAKLGSEVLGLRLTSRSHGKAAKVPLAGFPHHQIDNYLTRMVEAGHRVVVVEQVEDPKQAIGLVKRDVVRIVTAGTNPAIIDREEPTSSRIAALVREKDRWGYAWADVGSGEFVAGEFSTDELRVMTGQINPVEVVIPDNHQDVGPATGGEIRPPIISKLENWVWEPTFARQTLLDHFGTIGLKGFGLEHLDLAVSAAGALLHYLKDNLRTKPDHLTSLSRAEVSGKLLMESSTRRNLELVESLTGNKQATLFAVINRSVTNAGRRLLYDRLLEPLADRALIEERFDAVEEMNRSGELCTTVRTLLKRSGDLQRSLARLATGRGSARDLVTLRETLGFMPDYLNILKEINSRLLQSLVGRVDLLENLMSSLENALVDEPPLSTTEGKMLRDGYDAKIDQLREIRSSGKSWIKRFEQDERDRTGIPKLKVAYHRVFGYYIEVTKSFLGKVPDDYIRRQTLVSAERYITPALQEYAEEVTNAEEMIAQREHKIYQELVVETLQHSHEIQNNARVLAELDFLTGLAVLAKEENYCRPRLDNSDTITLIGNRHPVVEKLMTPGREFIPNDLRIGGCDDPHILIITGPNMAGKSTYLRQVALTVILAQMGSFVPAEDARIGIVDKLFTRIGALDNLAGGESTFLVEMQETASILHNATAQSLVLFDEVGRGTSTFDGLSLAWAIVEHLHETPKLC